MRSFIFLLTIIILLCGCSPINSSSVPENTTGTFEYIHFDPEFSLIELHVIMNASQELTDKSHGFIKYKTESWPAYDNSNSGLTRISTTEETEANCAKHVLIMRTISTDSVIMDLQFKLGYSIAGYTRRTTERCGTAIIYLVMDQIYTSNQLRLVTMHELLHDLKMNHDKGRTLMAAKGFEVDCVTKRDWERFCDIWNCRPQMFEYCE